ncbi:hypothetical protein ACJZ2D_000133 [Fusarium nematophilum]
MGSEPFDPVEAKRFEGLRWLLLKGRGIVIFGLGWSRRSTCFGTIAAWPYRVMFAQVAALAHAGDIAPPSQMSFFQPVTSRRKRTQPKYLVVYRVAFQVNEFFEQAPS